MSEHTKKPQPPAGQYGQGQPPPGQYPTPQPPAGQYPPGQPPTGHYPPTPSPTPYPPGQQPPGQPPAGQYPPGQPQPAYPPGQQPPDQPPTGQPPYPSGQQPPGQPPAGQYPPGRPPTGQYPPGQPPTGQYPPGQPPTGQYPPSQPPPGQPPTGQYPPGQPPTGQYPPSQPPPGQYPPPQQPPGQPPTGQYPPGQPPTGQYPPSQPPGQYPPPQQPPGQPPPGQYPPGQPPTGQYPPSQPPTPYPPGPYPPGPGPYAPEPGGYGTPPVTDPCDQDQTWGPPKIRTECCPTDRTCCGGDTPVPCSWDDVDDPCVRASSGDCGFKWTKLSCKCESSNAECNCDEWDCGYHGSMCVPCKPCDGLIPEGDDPGTSGCDDPQREGCSSEDLRRQLEANQKCISSRQAEKAKLDAEIKARQDREKELAALISDFDKILDKYKAERHKLVCREDCLNGFYRDTSKTLQERFPKDCLDLLNAAINGELCRAERTKCCQKNLEWKLEKATRLIWEQKEADKAWKKADEAFGFVKDLPKWMGDVFTDLEKLKDQIAQALNDKDPQKHRWAFFLFYWRFVPRLCKRFPVAFCCETHAATEQTAPADASAAAHIGCKPGDWHPSKIDVETLRKLICCAWDTVRTKKQELEEKNAAVEAAKHNLAFIKKQVEDNTKNLDDRIKSRLEGVVCGAASSR